MKVVGWSPFSHMDQATIEWIIAKAQKEVATPDHRAAFIYGTATVKDSDSGHQVYFETNTGGENSCQLILMLKFFQNLKALVAKPGGKQWLASQHWRMRLLLRIAMLICDGF